MKHFTILIFIVSILELFYQYFLQVAALKKNYLSTLLFSFVILISFNLIYFYVLKNGIKLGIAHIAQHSFGIILIFLMGYFVFNQKVEFKQIIGIVLVVIGLFLVSYYDKSHTH